MLRVCLINRRFIMYLADWSESGLEGLKADFQIDSVDGEILFAAYTYEDYSGDAFVLFRKDGKLFEVNGGHCSCYGLEGQWEPEETTKESLMLRLSDKWDMVSGYGQELNEVLSSL